MAPKDAEGIANSVDPDQSALFALTYLSKNLGSLIFQKFIGIIIKVNTGECPQNSWMHVVESKDKQIACLCFYGPVNTIKVMPSRSVTLFLDRLRPRKRLTSTQCT